MSDSTDHTSPVTAATTSSTVSIRQQGRRYYILDAPYAARATLRDASCHWDPEQRAWWTGKQAVAEQLITRLAGQAEKPQEREQERVDPNVLAIIGRATYKGKSYYLLAAGRSSKDDRPYAKLCSRDGDLVFWVKDFTQFEVVASYRDQRSINGLKAFATDAKTRQQKYGCSCTCHGGRHCDCGSGWCAFHHDGCDRCGCES